LALRHVADEHHRHLALLDEDLDERLVHPRRDVPVDPPYVVARVVRAHLAEAEALALEDGRVVAGELLVREPLRADLDAPELLEQLRRQRLRTLPLFRGGLHGTSTTSNTRR